MKFFDNVLDNVKSAADKAADKATDLYDISKIKVKSESLKRELNKKYHLYGKAMYHNAPDGVAEKIKGQIDELLDEIKDNDKDMDKTKEKLYSRKNTDSFDDIDFDFTDEDI